MSPTRNPSSTVPSCETCSAVWPKTAANGHASTTSATNANTMMSRMLRSAVDTSVRRLARSPSRA
jgi:hypothetical protein